MEGPPRFPRGLPRPLQRLRGGYNAVSSVLTFAGVRFQPGFFEDAEFADALLLEDAADRTVEYSNVLLERLAAAVAAGGSLSMGRESAAPGPASQQAADDAAAFSFGQPRALFHNQLYDEATPDSNALHAAKPAFSGNPFVAHGSAEPAAAASTGNPFTAISAGLPPAPDSAPAGTTSTGDPISAVANKQYAAFQASLPVFDEGCHFPSWRANAENAINSGLFGPIPPKAYVRALVSKFSKESQKRCEAAQLFNCDTPHSLFEQMQTLYAPNERELMRSLDRMQQAPEEKCAVFVKRIEAQYKQYNMLYSATAAEMLQLIQTTFNPAHQQPLLNRAHAHMAQHGSSVPLTLTHLREWCVQQDTEFDAKPRQTRSQAQGTPTSTGAHKSANHNHYKASATSSEGSQAGRVDQQGGRGDYGGRGGRSGYAGRGGRGGFVPFTPSSFDHSQPSDRPSGPAASSATFMPFLGSSADINKVNVATAEANATRRGRPPRAEQVIDEESPADTSDAVHKDASPAWQRNPSKWRQFGGSNVFERLGSAQVSFSFKQLGELLNDAKSAKLASWLKEVFDNPDSPSSALAVQLLTILSQGAAGTSVAPSPSAGTTTTNSATAPMAAAPTSSLDPKTYAQVLASKGPNGTVGIEMCAMPNVNAFLTPQQHPNSSVTVHLDCGATNDIMSEAAFLEHEQTLRANGAKVLHIQPVAVAGINGQTLVADKVVVGNLSIGMGWYPIRWMVVKGASYKFLLSSAFFAKYNVQIRYRSNSVSMGLPTDMVLPAYKQQYTGPFQFVGFERQYYTSQLPLR